MSVASVNFCIQDEVLISLSLFLPLFPRLSSPLSLSDHSPSIYLLSPSHPLPYLHLTPYHISISPLPYLHLSTSLLLSLSLSLLPLNTHPTFFSILSLFVVGASSFQSPRSPILCFFYRYSFFLHVFSYNITPPQLWSSYLSVSTHFHLLITTSSSFFHSTSVVVFLSFSVHPLQYSHYYIFFLSFHLSCGLPIFRCPPTSIFSLLHLLLSFIPPQLWSSYLSVSTHFNILITTSSFFHSTSVVVFLSFGVHPLQYSHYYIFLFLSFHLSCGLPIFQCPPTSIFSLLHLLSFIPPQLWSSYLSVSTHFNILITTSSSFIPPQLWSSYLSVSTHFNILITTSSFFHSTSVVVFLSFSVHPLQYSHYYIFFLSFHLSCGLPIFQCPPTSIFSLLHLLSFIPPQLWSSYLSMSTHFNILITTSSFFHSTSVVVFLSFNVHPLQYSHYYIFFLSLHLSCGLPIFQCPPTSIFSLLHLLSFTPPQLWSSYLSVSTHFNILITTSSSFFHSTSVVVFLSFGVHPLQYSHNYIFFLSLHLSCGLPIFQCPPTSIFSLLHLLSFFHSTSVVVFLSFSVHPLQYSHYYIFFLSLHLSCGLPIFQCPPTSIFSLLHLLLSFTPPQLWSSYLSVSTHFNILITTSSFFHSTSVVVFLSFSVHPLQYSHYYIFFLSLHLSCGLPIFQCPPTSIFSLLHLLSFTPPQLWSSYLSVSTHFNILITTSSFFHSTSVVVFLSFSVHPLPSSHYYIFFFLSLHLSCGLPIFQCPPTSIFSLLHLLSFTPPQLWSSYLSVSTHFNILITTSSFFHSTSVVVFLSFSVHPLQYSHYYIFFLSLHLSCGLPIFQCPPTSIFSLLHLLLSFTPPQLWSSYLSVSTHFNILITTSSFFHSTSVVVFLSFGVHPLQYSHYYIFFLSFHLSCGLPIFQCPPTSIFSLLHLLLSFTPPQLWSSYLSVSTHFNILITTSSFFHSTSVVVFLSFGVHPLQYSHYYIFFLSLHLSCGLPIFRCPPTSIFSLLHLLSFIPPQLWSSYLSVSTHFNILITTSSFFHSTSVVVFLSFNVHPLQYSHYYIFFLSFHLSCGLPIFQCPPTSIFSLLHLLSFTPPQLWSSYLSVSTHFNILITTSSFFHSTSVVVFLSFGVHPLQYSHYYIFFLSLHLSCGLPIFQCPPTSIFSLLHLLSFTPPQLWSSYLSVSTHFNILITTSSFFHSTSVVVFLSFSVHPLQYSHYYIFFLSLHLSCGLPIFRCPPTSIFS